MAVCLILFTEVIFVLGCMCVCARARVLVYKQTFVQLPVVLNFDQSTSVEALNQQRTVGQHLRAG